VTHDSHDPASRTIDPSACALYTPGHRVHFIQAKRGWEADPATYRTGALLSVEDDGWLTAQLEGETVRLWNHEAARLRRIAQPAGLRVALTRYGVLHVPHERGRYCFSVSTDGPSPCQGPAPAATRPMQRIASHGGFLLPAEEIRRLLGRAA
jgi:hypothetical protein